MAALALVLLDVRHSETYEGIRAFVAEDSTGSFGILPGHARFMTALLMGLCRFQAADGRWLYVASAGGLLYCRDNRVRLTTRHFFVDADYNRISAVLSETLLQEENRLHTQKQSLRRMEEEVLKRLWEAGDAGLRSYDRA